MSEDVQEEIKKLFNDVENLLLVEAKNDPSTDPYKSKYKARDLLEILKSTLQKHKEQFDKFDAMLAHIWLQMGIISVDTEEPHMGEEHFKSCTDLIQSKEIHPDFIITCISIYNNLGLLWSQRTEWERAFDYFGNAEKYYKEFKESNQDPVDAKMLFVPDSKIDKALSLEKLYTLTLYYLAQCYIHKKDSISSAVCCHTTLKRQLQYKDYNNSEWSLNMATLSQVCIENNAFHLARECLYVASDIHIKYKPELEDMKIKDEEKYKIEYEKWLNVGADIDRCWAKYGFILMSVSKERLMGDDDAETMKEYEPPDELKKLCLDPDMVPNVTSPITANYLLTYEDAIKVFNKSLKHLNQAREHFSLTEHATDHARVVQEISHLYQALAFFVDSEADRCKLHKRRVTELENVIKQFNSKYYVTICREIWYELGEVYSDMYELKHDILVKTSNPTTHQYAKINYLIKNSLNNYIQFIQSFKDVRTNEYPNKYADEWEKFVLTAFFFSARLLSKIVLPDKVQMRNNLVESLNNYQYIIDYCNKNPDAAQKFRVELPLCKEMVTLLPVKIKRLSAELDDAT